MRVKPRIGDFIVIFSIMAVAVSMTLMMYKDNTRAKKAVITQNNVVLKEIRLDNLSQDLTIHYQGEYPGTIEATNGKIRFSHAECPDQVCVHTGWISMPGQIAVCLPAGVIIKIEGSDSELDIMAK